jgi:3-deoxy-D-manno-octulosonate 8-phosphate phosphatase (KDO 8-P phosphatase)
MRSLPFRKEAFTEIGGKFFVDHLEIERRMRRMRALILDWDGVWNSGQKSAAQPSTFSESDSAGLNTFRFSYWLSTHEVLPIFIATGQHNPIALELAQREHYQGVFSNLKNKATVADVLKEKWGFRKEELTFVYDDAIDLPLALICGLRILVGRASSPMFEYFIREDGLAEYCTGSPGGFGAVREMAELLATLNGNLGAALRYRTDVSPKWLEYMEARANAPAPIEA